MKYFFILLIVFISLLLYATDNQQAPLTSHTQNISLSPEHIKLPSKSRTSYEFLIPPISLMTSYWDYMIAGYVSPGVRVQSPNAGNGVFVSYMGQRTPTGERRVYNNYINHEGNVSVESEIPEGIREGYISHDIDRESGIPIFAWNSNTDNTDPELEVNVNWDAFLEGIPGMLTQPEIVINNPITSLDFGEFIWPEVQIGPSPLAEHRRVYIFTTNAATYSANGHTTENIYYAFADFTTQMLREGNPLSWSYASIPTLDEWHNESMTTYRRFFHTTIVGEDGKIYVVGHHLAIDMTSGLITNEPYLDVFINTNYGEDGWTQYSINPEMDIDSPLEERDVTVTYYISGGSHDTGYVSPDGHVHFPIIFSFRYNIGEGIYSYPYMSYMKDVDFNSNDHSFLIHDLYPAGIHPNDGNPVLPWDINEDGIEDTTATGQLAYTPAWPYVYWDNNACDAAMEFHYNTVKFTKMNEQGMVAAVWSSSLNALLYHLYPQYYPELIPYSNVPEVFISVYPVIGQDGPQWSEPVSLNSVDTSEFHPNGDSMIPEWAYPGDYIEYLGDSPEGYKTGKLHLMFFDDNSWGAACISPAVGQANGGRVMYTTVKLVWSPEFVGNNDPVSVTPSTLQQNYPNPFNPTTIIEYNVTKQGQTSLTIFNVRGQRVKSLIDEIKQTGQYNEIWDGTSDDGNKVGSGVYFYRLENSGKSLVRKMVLLK